MLDNTCVERTKKSRIISSKVEEYDTACSILTGLKSEDFVEMCLEWF